MSLVRLGISIKDLVIECDDAGSRIDGDDLLHFSRMLCGLLGIDFFI